MPGYIERRRSVVERGGRRPGTDWATFFGVALLLTVGSIGRGTEIESLDID